MIHTYNGILLNHKNECNNAIYSNLDGPRDYHIKWNKSHRERQISYDITHKWNLIFFKDKINLQNRDRVLKILKRKLQLPKGKGSVQLSCSVVSDSFRPHESQHARPSCSSPTPGVYSNSCPSSWWSHPAISSSIVPFSSCPQALPASVFSNESTLRLRWPKYWIFSFSISPSSEHQDWSPLEWTGWISLQSKGLSRVLSNTTVQKLPKGKGKGE